MAGITKCDMRCFLCKFDDCILEDSDLEQLKDNKEKEYKTSAKHRATSLSYYYQNREKCKAKRKARYKENPEREIQYSRDYKKRQKGDI